MIELLKLNKQELNYELKDRAKRYSLIRFPRGRDYNALLVIPRALWNRLNPPGQHIFGVVTRDPDLWLYNEDVPNRKARWLTLDNGSRKIIPKNPAYVTQTTRCILHVVGKCSFDAIEDPRKKEIEEIAEARLLERFYPDLKIESEYYDKRRKRFPMRPIRNGDILEIPVARNQNFTEWLNDRYDSLDDPDEPYDPRYDSGQDEAGQQHDQFRHSYEDDAFYEMDGQWITDREQPGAIDSFQKLLAIAEYQNPDLSHHALLAIARKQWSERNERRWVPRKEFLPMVGRWRYESV